MQELKKECPKCGCPFWTQTGTATADAYGAWKDAEGNWYYGPAEESTVRSCNHCGWSQRIEKRRGKMERLESDAI